MLEENDFVTVLSDGEDIPARRVGDHYIVSYEFVPAEEFLVYAKALITDEGDEFLYSEDDVRWEVADEIEFGDRSEFSRIVFNRNDPHAGTPITLIECW